MKVKNIAFSGFAAAILTGVCGAAQAEPLRLASQDYVDAQVEVKQDKVTAANAGEGITISVDDQGNLNKIGVNFDVVASNQSVTDKIGDAITSGDEFKDAVNAAIQGAVADGVVGETIDEKIGATDAQGNDVTLTTTAQTAYGAINELDAEVGTLDTQLNAEGGLVDDVEALDTQLNGEDGLASKVDALETAGYITESAADERYADIATEQVAADAAAAAKAAQDDVDALETVVSGEDGLVSKVGALETAGYITESAANAKYAGIATAETASTALTNANQAIQDAAAADTKAVNAASAAAAADTKAVAAQNRADAAYELAETKQTAGQVESAINTKLAAENYMSGNNIGAGSYLMLSDGAGNITWSSIVVVDKDGNNVQLTSDAPSTGGSQEPAGV